MTCKDCICYNVCSKQFMRDALTLKDFTLNCKDFRNKADYEKVVHCKDCMYKDECGQEIHLRNCGYSEIEFCSYGDRRINNVKK